MSGSETRSSAQPIDVLPTLFFMRQRAILDVGDAVGEFEEPRVVRHDQDGPAMISGEAGEDRHDCHGDVAMIISAIEARNVSKMLAMPIMSR